VVRQLAGAAQMPPAEVRRLRHYLSQETAAAAAAAALSADEGLPTPPSSSELHSNSSTTGSRSNGDASNHKKNSKDSSKGSSKSSTSKSSNVDSDSGSGRRPSSLGVVPPWQAHASEALLAAAPRTSIVRQATTPTAAATSAADPAKGVESQAGEDKSLSDALAETGFFSLVGDSDQSTRI